MMARVISFPHNFHFEINKWLIKSILRKMLRLYLSFLYHIFYWMSKQLYLGSINLLLGNPEIKPKEIMCCSQR